MSMFSSLNYFLQRATYVLHETTEPTLDILLKEINSVNKLSLIADSESSTFDDATYSKYLHLTMSPGNFSNEAETNTLLGSSTTEKWANIISLFTSISKAPFGLDDTYTNESDVHFLNETHLNADHLLKSWWHIFDERYLRHGWGWTIILTLAYVLILAAGVTGNVMVILVVLLRPQMRTVTNMFITNLAVADLFVIVFCVPSTLLANIFAPWILGSFMCKAVAYVQGVSVCASAYSLAAISLDRCQAIYRNYERPRGFSQTICVRTVFIIWIVAISLTIPWVVVFEVKVSDYDGLRYCVETWEVEQHGNIYFLVVNLICFYVIPLLLIFVSNWIIYCHVTHRHVPQESASAAPIRKLHRQTRHVVLRMLSIVTLTFLLCWLPLYILVIGIKFSQQINESEYKLLGILMPIAQWLGSWNSSINPILYAFLNKKFRRMFKSILPAWIPVIVAGEYEGSIRTPSFTNTVYTRKSYARSRADSKIDYHCHYQSGRRNVRHPVSLLVSRFRENKGTLATTTVQVLSMTIPATAVLICDNPDNIFDTAIADIKPTTTATITDL